MSSQEEQEEWCDLLEQIVISTPSLDNLDLDFELPDLDSDPPLTVYFYDREQGIPPIQNNIMIPLQPPFCMPRHMDPDWRLTSNAFNSWMGQVEDSQGTEVIDLTPLAARSFATAYRVGRYVMAEMEPIPSAKQVQDIVARLRRQSNRVEFAQQLLYAVASTAYEDMNTINDAGGDPERAATLEKQGDFLTRTAERINDMYELKEAGEYGLAAEQALDLLDLEQTYLDRDE